MQAAFMNRKKDVRWVIAGVLCSMMWGAAVGWAQPMSWLGVEQLFGTVLSVNQDAGVLKLETQTLVGSAVVKRLVKMTFGDETIISQGARPLKPEDLRTGSMVEIDYRVDRGMPVAQWISVQPGPSQ